MTTVTSILIAQARFTKIFVLLLFICLHVTCYISARIVKVGRN